MLMIENRDAWHPAITNQIIRDACSQREHLIESGRAAAEYVESGDPVPKDLREPSIDILLHGHPKVGFCIFCGTKWEGVEPDDCNEECLDCGEPEVFGCSAIMDEIGKGETQNVAH